MLLKGFLIVYPWIMQGTVCLHPGLPCPAPGVGIDGGAAEADRTVEAASHIPPAVLPPHRTQFPLLQLYEKVVGQSGLIAECSFGYLFMNILHAWCCNFTGIIVSIM